MDDPRRSLLRSILREDWILEAEQELRFVRRRRKDYKGDRVKLLTRVPAPLAEDLRDRATSGDLSVSEFLATLVFAYLRRTGPPR